MKYKIFVYFLLISLSIFSQKKYAKEISLVSDNDLYTSIKNDRYYTNGMFFSFRHLANFKNQKLEKKIFEWKIGHEMFTPYKSVVSSIDEHDRPFAGHLFGSFGIHRVYKKNSIINTTIQIGIIGPNAFAKELQEIIHNMYGFKKAKGWKHQIKTALSLNLNASYVKQLTNNKTNNLDISWVSNGSIGTTYTNLSSGFYARIATKANAKITNSIAFNTHLNNNSTHFKRAIESFFYIQPMIKYALYDATLQGSFLNTTSDVTKELNSIVFKLKIGYKFTVNRFNFGYVFNYNTSKSKGLKYTSGNNFGSIIIQYLLH